MCAKELMTLEDMGALSTTRVVHAIPVLEKHLYLLVSAHVHGNTAFERPTHTAGRRMGTAGSVSLNTLLTGRG